MIADDYRAIAKRRAAMAREREGMVETWCSIHGAGLRRADAVDQCGKCFDAMLQKHGGRVVKVSPGNR